MAHLYRDDVRELYAMLEGVSSAVILRVGEFELEGLNELEELSGTMTELKVAINYPYVSLDLSGSGWLYAGNGSDPTSRGLVDQGTMLLRKRMDWPRLVATGVAFLLPVAAVCILLFSSVLIDRSTPFLLASTMSVLLVGGAIWYWAMRQLIYRPVLVVLADRVDAPSFWRRNADDLVKIIVAAIVGFFLGKL